MSNQKRLESSLTVFAIECDHLDRVAFDPALDVSDLILVTTDQVVLLVREVRVERCFDLLESGSPADDYASLRAWIQPVPIDLKVPAGIPVPEDLRQRRYKGYGRASPRTDGTAVFDLSF